MELTIDLTTTAAESDRVCALFSCKITLILPNLGQLKLAP